jgi:hypothetical protein
MVLWVLFKLLDPSTSTDGASSFGGSLRGTLGEPFFSGQHGHCQPMHAGRGGRR